MLASVACADVRTSHPASSSERQAARALVTQLVALSERPDASARILTATDAAPLLALVAPQSAALPPRPDFTPLLSGSLSSCFIATDMSATLSQCEFADHVVDGTWSHDAHNAKVHAEMVDVFVFDSEAHGSVAIEASLVVGDELSGTLSANIMWTLAIGEFMLDVTVRADGLLVEGPDCASGGTITISATHAGDGDSGNFTSTTSLWFGPGCEDVHIAR